MNHYLVSSSLFIAVAVIGGAISPSHAQSANSLIKGTVIYPSEILPAQKVCAENRQTKQLFCTETKQSQQDFAIPLRAGSYVVFALECNKTYRRSIICRDGYRSRRAYYNKHVKCGLTFQCGQKHQQNSPIVIRITAGQTITNIKPHDWYSKN
jgi:hypothetical protein